MLFNHNFAYYSATRLQPLGARLPAGLGGHHHLRPRRLPRRHHQAADDDDRRTKGTNYASWNTFSSPF